MRSSPPTILSLSLLALGALGCPSASETPMPLCGDARVEAGEQCDDGNLWGGDGCTEVCTTEAGPFEAEPNDAADEAGAIEGAVTGSLRRGDTDCFALDVTEAAAVRATVSEAAVCSGAVVLELFDGDGARVASGLPDTGGCTAIEPDTNNDARYLIAGPHVLCVSPIFEAEVRSYSLAVETLDSCSDLAPLAPGPGQDLEGDGIADVCDPDDDDDGVLDADDNCPTVPNGPTAPFPWSTADAGFVNQWMVLGAFTGGLTPGACETSPEAFAGVADADIAPELGDVVDETPWFSTFSWPGGSAIVNFNRWFSDVAAPREAYVAAWVRAPDARSAALAVGSDDGQTVWLNGEEVGRKLNCSGVGVDQLLFPVSLEAGWNRLVHKVYDGGGGWGVVARFYEPDEETPMTDLDLSVLGPLQQDGSQRDTDGDGLGDLCDPTP